MTGRWWAVTGAAAAVALAGIAAVLVVAHGAGGSPAVARTVDAAATAAASVSPPPPPPPPLRVLSVGHATAATPVAQLGAVTVTFSAPVGPALTPTLTPALAGSWSRPTPTSAVFTATAAPLPGQRFTVSLLAGTQDEAGGALASGFTAAWTTRAASPARLQQLLAEAGYLPLSFRPATAEPATTDELTTSAYAPVSGSYAWSSPQPPALQALYTGPTSALLTRGAVLAFESDHQLATDGAAGPQVWSALVADAAAHRTTSRPYTYVYVNKSRPQSLTVYRDGKPVLTTPANTGVSRAQTPAGSWPVYARYQSQTMSGTNPDGSHYSDPGVPWISYFVGGDAVHGFPRASYGSPQSVGCVELPIATAETVYGLMGYGDIVTVAG